MVGRKKERGGERRRKENESEREFPFKIIFLPHIWYSGLVKLTAVPYDQDLNPGEGIDVCKCIVPLRHGGSLNSRRVTRTLVRLMEGEERK
ncbi:hypothetical protein TNCV_79131 [Trichonephila clavipes]|nr:hypothetical protein TNCV_79131 [Trichonephila clavipes]